jgi:hypothetical protein
MSPSYSSGQKKILAGLNERRPARKEPILGLNTKGLWVDESTPVTTGNRPTQDQDPIKKPETNPLFASW